MLVTHVRTANMCDIIVFVLRLHKRVCRTVLVLCMGYRHDGGGSIGWQITVDDNETKPHATRTH